MGRTEELWGEGVATDHGDGGHGAGNDVNDAADDDDEAVPTTGDGVGFSLGGEPGFDVLLQLGVEQLAEQFELEQLERRRDGWRR